MPDGDHTDCLADPAASLDSSAVQTASPSTSLILHGTRDEPFHESDDPPGLRTRADSA